VCLSSLTIRYPTLFKAGFWTRQIFELTQWACYEISTVVYVNNYQMVVNRYCGFVRTACSSDVFAIILPVGSVIQIPCLYVYACVQEYTSITLNV